MLDEDLRSPVGGPEQLTGLPGGRTQSTHPGTMAQGGNRGPGRCCGNLEEGEEGPGWIPAREGFLEEGAGRAESCTGMSRQVLCRVLLREREALKGERVPAPVLVGGQMGSPREAGEIKGTQKPARWEKPCGLGGGWGRGQ